MKKFISSILSNDRDRYEFLPAALEITDSPPMPLGRIVAISISIFFLLAILWASFSHIDIIAISQGKTTPTGNVKTIQPLETGVIKAIHIQDGDFVKAGDLLFELDPTVSVANLESLEIDLQRAKLDLALSSALLKENPLEAFIPPENISDNLIQSTKNQLIEEYTMHQSSLDGISSDIKRLESLLRNSEIQKQKLEDIVPLIKEQLQTQQSLLDRGITKKITVQALNQELR